MMTCRRGLQKKKHPVLSSLCPLRMSRGVTQTAVDRSAALLALITPTPSPPHPDMTGG